MQVVRLTSGIIAHRLTDSEQNALLSEINKPVYTESTAFYTPRDNKKYFILSEKEIDFENFEATIKANGKTFKVKYNICNQHSKIDAAVRKAYKN